MYKLFIKRMCELYNVITFIGSACDEVLTITWGVIPQPCSGYHLYTVLSLSTLV